MQNKKCLRCLVEKDFSKFYKDKRKKDGLFSYCKDCHNGCCSKYHNSEKFRSYQRKFVSNKYHTNEQFRLEGKIRGRLHHALKNNSITGKTVETLGCTIPEFKQYIESKFKEGMSWNNLAVKGWHLDHIKPLSAFDLSKQSEFSIASHYTNIQPLWSKENISKGNKFENALSI